MEMYFPNISLHRNKKAQGGREKERERAKERGKQAKELEFLITRAKNYIVFTMPGFTIYQLIKSSNNTMI